jgi:hypothetical protein
MIHADDNTKPTQLIWHYTSGLHIASILRDGRIRHEDSFGLPLHQRPMTWFSLNQVWEPTASKALLIGIRPAIVQRATADVCHGLFRIGVDLCVAPFRVNQLIRIAGATRRVVKDLARVGISCGACPEDWRFTPNEVFEDRWRAIQVWDEESETWVPYEHERRIPLRRDELVGAFD